MRILIILLLSGLGPLLGADDGKPAQYSAVVTGIVLIVVASALFVADRIAFLEKGRFTFVGTPDEARRSDIAALRAFLAAEEAAS